MKQPKFVDCEEVTPGVWASGADIHKARAAAVTLPDLNKRRDQTIDDIPNAGGPLVFWIMLGVVVLLALMRGH